MEFSPSPAGGLAVQAQALWAALDDLAASDPERYQRFIQEQLHAARGESQPSSSSASPPHSSSSSSSSSVSCRGTRREQTAESEASRAAPRSLLPFRPRPGFVIRAQLKISSPKQSAQERSVASPAALPLIVELPAGGSTEAGEGAEEAGEAREISETLEYFVNVCSSPLTKAPTRREPPGVCTLLEELDAAFLPISVGVRRLLQKKEKTPLLASSESNADAGLERRNKSVRRSVPLFLDRDETQETAETSAGGSSRVCVDVCVHPLVVQRCQQDLRFKFYFSSVCLSRLLPLEQLLLLQKKHASQASPLPGFLSTSGMPRLAALSHEEAMESETSSLASLLQIVQPKSCGDKSRGETAAPGFFGDKEREALENIAAHAAATGADPGALARAAGEIAVAPHSIRFPKLLYKGGKEACLHLLQGDCVGESPQEKKENHAHEEKSTAPQEATTSRSTKANDVKSENKREEKREKREKRDEGEGRLRGEVIIPSAEEVEKFREEVKRQEEEKRRREEKEAENRDLIAAALKAREDAAQTRQRHFHRSGAKEGDKGSGAPAPLIQVLAEEAFPVEEESDEKEEEESRRQTERGGERAKKKEEEEAEKGEPDTMKQTADEFYMNQVSTRRLHPRATARSSDCRSPQHSSSLASSSSPSSSSPSSSSSSASSCSSFSSSSCSSSRLPTAEAESAEAPGTPLWRVVHRRRERLAEKGEREEAIREVCVCFSRPVDPLSLEVAGSEREIEVAGCFAASDGATLAGEDLSESARPFCIRIPLPYAVDPEKVDARLKKKKNLLTLLCKPTASEPR
ncbi:UNVERIFIED_CONTAM: hypothetical protein HHA_257640 [Hammondia hammondi]|eukprot:XP_008883223.1 hypothetical protein HHA_257640 [Hammondia hammondi]